MIKHMYGLFPKENQRVLVDKWINKTYVVASCHLKLVKLGETSLLVAWTHYPGNITMVYTGPYLRIMVQHVLIIVHINELLSKLVKIIHCLDNFFLPLTMYTTWAFASVQTMSGTFGTIMYLETQSILTSLHACILRLSLWKSSATARHCWVHGLKVQSKDSFHDPL